MESVATQLGCYLAAVAYASVPQEGLKDRWIMAGCQQQGGAQRERRLYISYGSKRRLYDENTTGDQLRA